MDQPETVLSASNWVETMMKVYQEGGSDVEVCKELRCSLRKYNELCTSNQKFSELVEYGRLMSQAWWMEQARKALMNRQFNTTLWAFVMKNRFGWADKTENVDKILEVGNLDEQRAKLEKMLPDLLKRIRPDLTEAGVLKELQNARA